MKGNEAMKQVVMITGLSWEALCALQFESGIAYLNDTLKHDPDGIQAMVASCHFWSWWRMLWSNRDAEFLLEVEAGHVHRAHREGYYRTIHRIDRLVARPARFMIENAKKGIAA